MKAPALALLCGGLLVACGGRPAAPRGPDPAVLVPQLFDPTDLYRDMGFLAHAEPVPFVASVAFLAGDSADSTLALIGVSLAANALSFRKSGRVFEARYRVDVLVEREGEPVQRLTAEEAVRVGTFAETLRADESVIFQQVAAVPPGTATVRIVVRDVFGDETASDQQTLRVPRFHDTGLARPVAVYGATSRGARGELPGLLLNPRATVPFGTDSLRFYLEGYGQVDSVPVRARNDRGEPLWHGTARLGGAGEVRSGIVAIGTEELPVGRITLEVVRRADTVATPALVSFSDQWTITNFDDVLSLLRFFGRRETIAALRAASPEERVPLWRAFWRDTDPNPTTPRNEALEEYFRRVQVANARFVEAGTPGWLTDRGEVFITLGEPDDMYDQRASFETSRRVIRWVYVRERLAIDFLDDTGFGRFEMTPLSRSEFERAAARRRDLEDR